MMLGRGRSSRTRFVRLHAGVLILLAAQLFPAIAPGRQRCAADLGSVRCRLTIKPIAISAAGVGSDGPYGHRVIACGPRIASSTQSLSDGATDCQHAFQSCQVAPGVKLPPDTQVAIDVTYDRLTNQVIQTSIDCTAPIPHTLPSIAAITAEATKRAPQPHTTTGGTNYLLYTAIVFYIQPSTPTTNLTNPTLGPFTLAGHTFTIHLHLHHTTWNWNDDTTTTDTTHQLGHPYTDADPCENNTHCSHYIAHTYTQPGTYTPTVQAHWTATYTLDNNPQPQPIPGDITRTDPTGRTITIREAHATLIPTNPP